MPRYILHSKFQRMNITTKINIQLALMNYNTTYHKRLGCKPSTVFHDHIHICNPKLPTTELANQLQKQTNPIQSPTTKNPMLLYID